MIYILAILITLISCKDTNDQRTNKESKVYSNSEKDKIYKEFKDLFKEQKYTLIKNRYEKEHKSINDSRIEKIYKESVLERERVNENKAVTNIENLLAKNKLYDALSLAKELKRKNPTEENEKRVNQINDKVKELEAKFNDKQAQKKKDQDNLTSYLTTCNSVIPQKFPKIYKHTVKNKYILASGGYLEKGEAFRWTWSVINQNKHIKCIILEDGSYRVTLEKL